MPELPEVETVRRQLADKVIGKEIAAVTVRDWKSVKHDRYFQKALVGQSIQSIDRSGKYLFFVLSDDDAYIIGHLKMTGRLIFVPADDDTQYGGGHTVPNTPPSQPHKHTRVIFEFTDGSHLYFNDMRKFGYLQRTDSKAVAKQQERLGPEPLTAAYTKQHLQDVLRDRRTTVKAVLLQQDNIAGIGNIYADEACWRARLRPDHVAGEVSDDGVQRLYDATQSVLADALAYGGTTMENFADTDGSHGNFTDRLAVFGRDGQPCPACGTSIKKTRVAGRGTHFCPSCQR